MGFNFGAFAGGLAEGGADAYKTMKALESQQKRDALIELQTKEAEQAMKGREALRSAIAEQGGEKAFTPSFSGTGGMDTNDVAPTPVQMSASERRAAIEQRAIAGGADPEAAMRYTATRRTADLSNAFDTTMDKLHKEAADRVTSIKTTAEAGGLKGLAETFGPELKKAFGHEIQFKAVPGSAGEIVAMDGKKVVGRYNSLESATQTLEGLVGQEFEAKFSKAMLQPGMFSSSKELSDYMNKQAELKNQGITAQAAARNAATNEMVGRAHANYYGAAAGAAGGGKPTSRTVMVGGGVDNAGSPIQKQPVTIVTKFDKTGAPVIAAYDMSGKPITDQKVLGQAQMAAVQGGGEEGGAPLASVGADLARAGDRYKAGLVSLDEYNKEVAAIKLMSAMPKPGGSLNPNAGGATPAIPTIQPRAIAYTKGGFEKWADAAKSGTPADKALGREILQGWVNNNELSVGEKQQALKLLK